MKKLIFILLALLFLIGCAAKDTTIAFHDHVLNTNDLSRETLEWLEWYNTLSKEEQLSISSIPAELHALLGYPEAEDVAVTDPTERLAPTDPLSEIPGGTRFIIDITDFAALEGLDLADVEELFFEDEENFYFFSQIKSEHIYVIYNNANSENIVSALENGRAEIADLDEFGIDYITIPKTT